MRQSSEGSRESTASDTSAAGLALDRYGAAIPGCTAQKKSLTGKRQGPFLHRLACADGDALDHEGRTVEPSPLHRDLSGCGRLTLAIQAIQPDRATGRQRRLRPILRVDLQVITRLRL